MGLKIPDLLQYELRHRLERWRHGVGRSNLRGWINEHPGWVIGLACLSVVLVGLVLISAFRSRASASFEPGKSAWFYDVNAGRLFVGRSKRAGPVPAPSGPLPDGGPAGFRAHVYSYVLDPNESELFVGFLERPDPEAGTKRPTQDMSDVDVWARGRLIRRVDDAQWVKAAGPEGQAILQELLAPNEKGQTPLHQSPGR